ncbi:MAG: carbamoyl-phosphate synthase large subunit, partial [Caulobacteraceae bacterium]|nr:carbamoyl-phosphate synthase large subunit [Caulobacteraceae bacterium]
DRASPRYDSLMAKVVVHAAAGGLPEAVAKTRRALSEFRIAGVSANIDFLQTLLEQPDVAAGEIHTRFIDEHMAELTGAPSDRRRLYFEEAAAETSGGDRGVALGQPAPPGTQALPAPLQGTVIALEAAEGETVRAGQTIAVIEAMKMEHAALAPVSGVVRRLAATAGEVVLEGQPIAFIEPAEVEGAESRGEEDYDLAHIRPDLAEVLERRYVTLDAARPDAVARRRKTNQRTARENLDDLLDPGSFTEYGAFVIGGRKGRASPEELIRTTPADGIITGLGAVNGRLFPEDKARVAAMAYDYTVLAGTQGGFGHYKTDRFAELALKHSLPVVAFVEGGGGRPGDTEWSPIVRGFEYWARLSGAVPMVAINGGRCFAGNAAFAGCSDVIIATKRSVLGMGGPAMIEGGGLGVFTPEEVGPAGTMEPNGVIDILVEDEAEAVQVVKRYLSYFQGPLKTWACADQRLLRQAVPENRLRAYDMRRVIAHVADEDSVLELRARFGVGMITAFARIEGRPMGVIANNPMHLGGAIDADAADKGARFLQLCEAFDLPVLSLSDTPGMMVGPESEKQAAVRHTSRLFVVGANLTVPILAVVLRKSYGLGAIAMLGGSYQAPVFSVAWPTAEFGAMGLEGSVRLGYRAELEAIADPALRQARYDEKLAQAYAGSKALRHAMRPELDDVIDPADTRRWIMAGLKAQPPAPPRQGKKLRWIDAW